MGLRTLVNLEIAEFRTENALIGQVLEVHNTQFICSVQLVQIKVGMIAANQEKPNYLLVYCLSYYFELHDFFKRK